MGIEKLAEMLTLMANQDLEYAQVYADTICTRKEPEAVRIALGEMVSYLEHLTDKYKKVNFALERDIEEGKF